MSISIKRKSPQRMKDISANLKTLMKTVVAVGFFGGKNPSKAYINEKGAVMNHKQIPPRPFFLSGAIAGAKKDKGISDFKEKVKDALKVKDSSKKIRQAFEILGEVAVEGVRKGIDKVESPALRPLTIALRKKKGNKSTKPLIDTGSMRKAVKYKVTTRGRVRE